MASLFRFIRSISANITMPLYNGVVLSKKVSCLIFFLSKRWKYRSYSCDIHLVAILISYSQFGAFAVSLIADSVIIIDWQHGTANTDSLVKSIGHQSILFNESTLFNQLLHPADSSIVIKPLKETLPEVFILEEYTDNIPLPIKLNN
jgi:hypothetical protein